MEKIDSQEKLEDVLAKISWEGAFFREWYLVSPSYIDPSDQAMVAPDSAPGMKLLICCQDAKYAGLELIFEKVEEINFSSGVDLCPIGLVGEHSVFLSFHGLADSGMRSQCLYFQFLDTCCWGNHLRYGKNN